jgi:hypothetical protein
MCVEVATSRLNAVVLKNCRKAVETKMTVARRRFGSPPAIPMLKGVPLSLARRLPEYYISDFSVVSLSIRDEVLSAEYRKIRTSQGTKIPWLSRCPNEKDNWWKAICIARLVAR